MKREKRRFGDKAKKDEESNNENEEQAIHGFAKDTASVQNGIAALGSLSIDAIAKAKQVLQIREKLKNIPHLNKTSTPYSQGITPLGSKNKSSAPSLCVEKSSSLEIQRSRVNSE
ncbi:uncharacterized protein LOC130744098 [Lotus japonicus]|uniref:uncharacterized protein LOC130744098 n=1 Tax=Lotus japonicus TaxID=34305 RepID=UPI0025885EAC|nr:uncharacterized protein LOC130744098 [Lotus japonicus]